MHPTLATTLTAWLRAPVWLRRALAVLALLSLVLVTTAAPSLADDGTKPPDPQPITDSSGVPIGAYRMLPIDRGSITWNQDKAFWSKPVDFMWSNTYNNTTLSILFNRFLMTFEWVNWIKGPAELLATGFESLIAGVQWLPFVAGMAGLVVGWLFMRGRTGAGFAEVAISAVLIALVTTVLANPVATITGPSGALAKTQEYGKSTSAELLSETKNKDGSQPEEILKKEAQQPMIDAFIRYPYQVAAFGKVIDNNPACKTAFDNVMKDIQLSTDATGEKIRRAVEGCDKEAAQTALNPDSFMVWNLWVGSSATGLLQLFLAVLGAIMIIAVLFLLYEGIKMIWSAKAAIIPGLSRTGLTRSLAMCTVYVFAIGIAFIFLTLYMIFIKLVFAQNWAQNPLILWNIVDLLLIVGIVVMIRMWIRGKKAGESIADKLRKLGAGSPDRKVRTITGKDVGKAVDWTSKQLWRRRMVDSRKKPDGSDKDTAPQDDEPTPSRPVPPGRNQRKPEPPQGAIGPGAARKQLPPPPSGAPVPALLPGPSLPPSQAGTGIGAADLVQGIVLSARNAKTPAERKKSAAGGIVRAAAQLHPYGRAAVLTHDGAKAVTNRAVVRRPPTLAQLALESKLRTRRPIQAFPVKR